MKIIVITFILLLQACTSQRVKEVPNFNLSGSDSKKEYEKFKLSRVSIHGGNFESEGTFTGAYAKQLNPLVEQISPKTMKLIEDSKFKERAFWGVWALWFATIFIKDSEGKRTNLYWAGMGATFGYIFYLDSERSKFADQFNQDLKSKFSPGFSYNFSF